MAEVQDHLTVRYWVFYADRLNIASAHHFLGLTKVTEKLQNWQEIDIISEGQNQKYINFIEFY